MKRRTRLYQRIVQAPPHTVLVESGKERQHVQLAIAGRVAIQVVVDQAAEVGCVAGIDDEQDVIPWNAVDEGKALAREVHADARPEPGGTKERKRIGEGKSVS